MEYINQKTLHELLAAKVKPAVTIYIPMLQTASPPHISENQTRFKNLVRLAIDKLHASRDTTNLAAELTHMIDEQYREVRFWEKQTPGLLICAAPGKLRVFHLPIDTEEYVAIDDAFHLAPVIDLVNNEQEFYVLALAQHNPRLHKGGMYGLQPSGLQLPTSLETALGIDELGEQRENQGSTTGLSGHTGSFNGRGGGNNRAKADRTHFFRNVDKIICESADRTLPMLIAGTEAEVAQYRSLSKYPNVLQASLSGNYTDAKLHIMFEKAIGILRQELVTPRHRAAIEEYNQLHGASPTKVADNQTAMTQAAEQGRIAKLLALTFRSGTSHEKRGGANHIAFPEAATSQLLNRLATQVWRMRGKIIGLSLDEMPSGNAVVATLRY